MTGRKHDRPGLPSDLERRLIINVAGHLKRQGQRAKALPHSLKRLQTGVRQAVLQKKRLWSHVRWPLAFLVTPGAEEMRAISVHQNLGWRVLLNQASQASVVAMEMGNHDIAQIRKGDAQLCQTGLQRLRSGWRVGARINEQTSVVILDEIQIDVAEFERNGHFEF